MDPLEPWVDVAAVRRMAEQLLAGSPLERVETSPDAGFGADFIGYAPVNWGTNGTTAVVPAPAPPQAFVRTAVSAPAPVAEPAPVQIVTPPPLPQDVPVVRPVEPVTISPPLYAPQPEPPLQAVPAPVPEPEPVMASFPAIVPPAVPADAPPPPVAERRGPLLDRLGRFREGLIRYTSAQGVFILDREGKPVMDDPSSGKLYFLARSLAQAYRPVAGQPGNVHVKINANLILEVIPVETPFGTLVLGAVVSHPLTAHVVSEIAAALKRAATPGEGNGGGA